MSLVSTLLSWLLQFKYVAVFLGTFFEGPTVMLASGFALHFGTFSLVPLFITLLLGDFVADICWYSLGRFGIKIMFGPIGTFVGFNPEIFERYKLIFHQHHTTILIASKLTNAFGAGAAVLVAAGAARVPIARYAILMTIGGVIWTSMLIALGYSLGNVYQIVPPELRIIFVVTCVLLLAGAAYFGVSYIRKVYGTTTKETQDTPRN